MVPSLPLPSPLLPPLFTHLVNCAQFLAALPPDIRNEVLEQERREQERLQRQAETQSHGPADIDTASLLASLPPELRQEILLDQSECFQS